MAYLIKSVKTFRGNEGNGFNATLYKKQDGKDLKVAFCIDEGNGGCYRWYPENDTLFAQFREYAEAEHPGIESEDHIISLLIDAYETRRFLMRHCRNKTLFRLKGDDQHRWRTTYHKYDEQVAQALKSRHGDELAEIANERFQNAPVKGT